MDDEEEIDIIGTYDDISSGQLLPFDYVWINTNINGNNFWSEESVPKSENLENNVEVLQSDEIKIEEPAPIPKIIDSEWTEEHITSPTDLIFEEDIPEVIGEVIVEECEEEEEELNDGDNKDQILSQGSEYHTEMKIYNDFEPAAFETHPPDINMKYIGPTNERSLLKVKIASEFSSSTSPSYFNLEKHSSSSGNDVLQHQNANSSYVAHNTIQKPPSKFKTNIKVNHDLFKLNVRSMINLNPSTITKSKKKKKTVKQKSQKTKFSTNLKKVLNERTKVRQNLKVNPSSSVSSGKGKKKPKRKSGNIEKNVTISHEAEKETPENEINPETIVKVNKCSEDSDVEIDVEDISTNDDETLLKATGNLTNSSETSIDDKSRSNTNYDSDATIDSKMKINKFHENVSDELRRQLKAMNKPTQELKINQQEVLEIEKYVNFEFFDGRATKTPKQYCRIRNHILSMWNSMRPNYVSKTVVRNGLKHGGDVNSISRIHRLLEQIGAINFGHEGQYFDYIRPLEDFISTFVIPQNLTVATTNRQYNNSKINNLGNERRQRIRSRRYASYSNSDLVNEANYTIIHMDGVIGPDPPRLNTDKPSTPIHKQIKNDEYLIKCLKFSKENIAPFKVSITLSTLLCLRLHSFSSNQEVMGFLGGYCSKSIGRNKISLTRYKPCRTSQQSGTMCEMCPVSQVEQSSSLGAEGYELLGWFHTHPLFPANPSRTDIRTQKEMQLQFSVENDKAFIGLILSCIDLTLKCIYIMPRDLHLDLGDNHLPYELDIDVIKDCTNFKNDVADVLATLKLNNCDTNVKEILDKFKKSSEELLNRFGYSPELFYNNIL